MAGLKLMQIAVTPEEFEKLGRLNEARLALGGHENTIEIWGMEFTTDINKYRVYKLQQLLAHQKPFNECYVSEETENRIKDAILQLENNVVSS